MRATFREGLDSDSREPLVNNERPTGCGDHDASEKITREKSYDENYTTEPTGSSHHKPLPGSVGVPSFVWFGMFAA